MALPIPTKSSSIPTPQYQKNYSNTGSGPSGGGVGGAVQRFLGFDPTPGFNIPNPFHNSATPTTYAPKAAAPINEGSTYFPQQVYGASTVAGSTAQPAWSPQDQAAYQQAVDIANSAINRLPNQLDIARGNVNAQYNQSLNGLHSGVNQARSDYQTGTTQNQQQYLGNQNQINQQSSASLRSLLRLLGGMGAGGGSEAQYLAPNLVGRQASQQLGGASTVYAQNAQGLDKNLNDYLNQEKGQEQQLNDWRTQQFNQAESQSNQNRVGLLQQLASLAAQRSQAMGGNGVAAQQPFIDQINGLNTATDNLARFNPTFSGNVPVYNAPELSTFQMNPQAQAQIQSQAQQFGSGTPYLNMLLGQQRRDLNQNPVF